MSVHSFSDASVNSPRARLRTVAIDLLTAFWGGSVSGTGFFQACIGVEIQQRRRMPNRARLERGDGKKTI